MIATYNSIQGKKKLHCSVRFNLMIIIQFPMKLSAIPIAVGLVTYLTLLSFTVSASLK